MACSCAFVGGCSTAPQRRSRSRRLSVRSARSSPETGDRRAEPRMVLSPERAPTGVGRYVEEGNEERIAYAVKSTNGSTSSATSTLGFGEQSVREAISAVARGEMVIVTDNLDRENEGDLIMAADSITTEDVAFMVQYTSGVLCASITPQIAERLKLTQMVPHNTDPKNTAFTVSCDYKSGTTTGISAADRAQTLRALADSATMATDFTRPGHIFPLLYHTDGVLKRAGHTEAALDLVVLANHAPVGVLAEIVDHRDGSMARRAYLDAFAQRHNLVMTSVADLIQYRRRHETHVLRLGTEAARLPTKYGSFDVYAFRSLLDDAEHLALVKGGPFDLRDEVLVRVETENVLDNVFGGGADGGSTLEKSLRRVYNEARGCVIYVREGSDSETSITRGLFHSAEISSPPRRSHAFEIAANILTDLNIGRVALLYSEGDDNEGSDAHLTKTKADLPFTVERFVPLYERSP